ncbi:MAG: AIR synthase-related protein, partial [Sphaerochaetaceae bacterium]
TPIFKAIEELGNVPRYEMLRTFNMGLGLTIVVAKKDAKHALTLAKKAFPMPVYEVGKLVKGKGQTFIEGVN